MIASVYAGFKRIRILVVVPGSSATVFTVSAVVSIFVSFVAQPFGCSGKLMRLPRSNVDDK